MPRSPKSHVHDEVAVQLRTASGLVFSGAADGIALHTGQGTIDVTPRGGSYVNLVGAAEIIIRSREVLRRFRLTNATASVKGGRLTMLAEAICEIADEPA